MFKLAIVSLILSVLPVSAENAGTRENWPSYGGTSHAWRYSALDQIRADNVRRLTPVWVFQTGDYADALQATPIVIDGVMYVSTAMSWVFALDAATGKPLWEYKYPPPQINPRYGNQNRGVAVGHGRVFLGTMDNHLVALDQKTGRELWNVTVEDPIYCGCNITGAPLIVKDKIIAGVTGGDSAHRGYLTAFDVRTGRLAWRFYTIPAPGEKGSETWPGDSWRFGGGATWMTGSYDSELNLLYWGVGNPAADFDVVERRGHNLYTGSVIALDPDTGKLKWHYQEIPQDVWDYDATYECILADLPVKGRTRKVLLHFNKAGYVWVLDRVTGEFIGAWPHVQHINWVKGITETGELVGRNEPERGKTKTFCPGAIGGRSWNHAAFSPRTNLLYSTALEVCSDITPMAQNPEPGASFFGGAFSMKAPAGDRPRGYIAAYDPVTGKRAWTWDYPYYLLASIVATAGDLIFSGDPEGNFFALDARTGAKLWSFQTGAGQSRVSRYVRGWRTPVYRDADRMGHPDRPDLSGAVARCALAASRVGDLRLRPSGGSALILALLLFAQAAARDPLIVERGAALYAQRCSVPYCHGPAGTAGRAPALAGRNFEVAALRRVIAEGIPTRGMPGFQQQLGDDGVNAVLNYVRTLPAPPPGNAPPPAPPPMKLTKEGTAGRDLFFDSSRFPGCSDCHAVGNMGGVVAAKLAANTTVDSIRNVRTTHIQTAQVAGRAGIPSDHRDR